MITRLSTRAARLTRRLASAALLLIALPLASQVLAAPVITSPASGSTLPSVAVNQSMSITLSGTIDNFPIDQWFECDITDPAYDGSPCLPAGLTLDPSFGSTTTLLHGAPTTAGTYTFKVSLNDNQSQTGVATYTLVVTSGSAPTLTSVSPNTGSTAGGTSVTLTGTNFVNVTGVTIGGSTASSVVNSGTSITSVTPAHAAGPVNVVVTTSNGTATLTNGFTYTVPAPTVGPVSATVASGSSANPITLNLSGGAATSVAVASGAAHGTATASGTSITYTPTAGFFGSDSFTYTATNTSGTSSPATVTLTVSAPTLVISPASLPNGTVNTAYSQSLNTTGGTAPYTYAITSGTLPTGLSLAVSSGSLTGTPSSAGTYNFTVTASDSSSGNGPATASRSYSVTINQALPVAGAVSATVAANSSANPITLSLSGGAATSVAVASAAAHGTATASGTTITYTPTAGYSGADSFTYTATNAAGTSSPATVTITVTAPTLVITPATLGTFTVGSAFNATLSASGGDAPYTFNVNSLPSGLSLNTSTGQISGTPTAAGAYSFTATVTDSNGATGSITYSGTVSVALPVASAVSATVAANSSANPITLSLSGGAATSVAVASAASHGTATASGTSITYTPTAGYSGTDSFTYTATNAAGTSSPATVTITVTAPTLVITPATLGTFTVGSAFNATLSASGGDAPYAFNVNSLPSGLSLNTSTGQISGTPIAAGAYSFTATVTDSNGATGSITYSGTVSAALPVASAVSATVAANSSANPITLNLSGGAATSVAVASAAAHGTATASGTSITYTPTAGYSGADSFTYTASNASGTSSPATVTITVTAPTLIITPATLGAFTVGSAYSTTLSASGGSAPYAFSASNLPSGLTLNPSTGIISGTPSAPGAYSSTVTVTDSNGATGSITFSGTVSVALPVASAVSATVAANSSANPITLNLSGGAATSVAVASAASHGTATASGTSITYTPTAGYSGADSFTYTASNASGTSSPATVTITVTAPTLVITPATLGAFTVGSAYSTTLSASGGSAPYAFSASNLPSGLALNPSTGIISGTPSAPGAYSSTVTVTDSNGAAGSITFSGTVSVALPVASAVSATVAANSSANSITLNLSGGSATNVAIASAAAHGSAVASGLSITYTPSAGYSGADSFTYTASNASGTSSPATVTLTISAPTLLVSPASLGAGTTGSPYSAAVSASGGTAPYTYSVTSGSLPTGMSLNAATGAISGTPTTNQTANFTLTVTDANGASGTQAYSINIAAVPITVPASSQILSVGESAEVDLTQGATGGPFTQANLGTVTPASAGRAFMVSRFSMRFVPSAAFAGTAVVRFSLQNGSGSLANSSVSFIIAPRPDPTKDAEVIGLLNAQTRAAERFASTQMDNFNRRLEQLHQVSCNRNSFNASVRKDGENVPMQAIASAVQKQMGGSANSTDEEKRQTAAQVEDGCKEDAIAYWSDGFINNGSTHARGAKDNSFTTFGLSAGVDYRLSPNAIAGIGFGYGNDRSDIGNNKTRSDADALGIATYLSLNLAPKVFVDGLLGYNRISFDSRRYITGSDAQYAKGSRDADQLFASLTTSYEYRQGPLSLTPYGRLNASTTRMDAFRESGGGIYGLSYDEQRQQNFTSFIGLRTGYDVATRLGVMTPKIGLAWGHNFSGSSDYKMRYTDQGSDGVLYRLKPDPLDSNFANLDLGLDFNLGRSWQMGVSYKTALGSDERNDTFRIGVDGKF
ncbi:putative Ig domain-containing protein [Pseudomonas sivasensis]|uniref:putative Ig domain-containing protein n=1 Tax=Pseudomonas sivasensis TaxID=1880678 RepID=UPI001933FF12|nr:putative Ig domain-containing protein [Pseudomonas sivasensis]